MSSYLRALFAQHSDKSESKRQQERGDEVTEFQIGDVVRLKTDGPERLKLIVRDRDATDGQILCRSECSQRIIWVSPLSCELVHRPDPHADLKQAIREVLLSDEFMTAFAAAWMKTPIIYNEEINTRPTYTNGEIV